MALRKTWTKTYASRKKNRWVWFIACSATPTEENYTCEVFFVFNFFAKQGLGWPWFWCLLLPVPSVYFGLFVLKATTRAAAASTTTTASTTIANKTSSLFGKPVICNVKKYRLEDEDKNKKGTRSLKVPWPIYQH